VSPGNQNEAVALILGMIRDGELDGREDEIYDAFKRRRVTRDRQARHLFHDQDRVAFSDKTRPLHLAGARATVVLDRRRSNRGTRIPVLVDRDSDSDYRGSIVNALPSQLIKLDE
jgi:hypothetical protein